MAFPGWKSLTVQAGLMLGCVGFVAAQTPPPAGPAASATSKPAASDVSMDERLRRMEEAYLRMEESNRRIQSQYDKLLERYDDLARKMSNGAPASEPASPRARTMARDGTAAVRVDRTAGTPGRRLADLLGVENAEVGQEPVALMPLAPELDPLQETGGAQGTGGRTGIRQQTPPPPPVARGRSAGGACPTSPRSSRSGRAWSGSGRRRGDRGPDQPVAAAHRQRCPGPGRGRRLPALGAGGGAGAGRPRPQAEASPGRIAFGEGLEFTSDDDEFKLQFHNLTQAEFRGFDRRDVGPLSDNLHDQFFIPRQRWYFVGDLTKNGSGSTP